MVCAPGYFCHHAIRFESATIFKVSRLLSSKTGLPNIPLMEILTPKSMRRSTRVRVEIPVSIVSLDRMRPFADECMMLVVSAQGCGFRSTRALQMETPIMISGLPNGGSVTARVANCLPLGSDGKYFMVGASLYTHGNFWGITNPPEDWNIAADNDPAIGNGAAPAANHNAKAAAATASSAQKKVWPYNLFSEGAEAPLGRR